MPNARLKGLGFVNILPRVRFAPLVSDDEQKQISHALLACRIKISTQSKDALAAGALQLVPTSFRVARHFNTWHQHLHICDILSVALPCDPAHHDARPHQRNSNIDVQNAITFFNAFAILCPVCGSSRRPGLFKPRTKHTWQNFRCIECDCTFPTNPWHCECQRPWHLCSQHHWWSHHHHILTQSRIRNLSSRKRKTNGAHVAQSRHRQGFSRNDRLHIRKGAMADLRHQHACDDRSRKARCGHTLVVSSSLSPDCVSHDRSPLDLGVTTGLSEAVELGEPTILSTNSTCNRMVLNVLRANPRLAEKFSHMRS